MRNNHEELLPQEGEDSLLENVNGSEIMKQLFHTAMEHVPDTSTGSRFGKYLIRQVIAERDDSWLVRAEDPILNRTVILKIDSSDSAAQTLQNVEAEGRAIAAVNHPNIVNVWGVEHCQGRPFLVLEHIDGMTLEQLCDSGPIGEPTALNIAKQIAEGLTAIHQRGLLHLDLKPSNIMITREGVVKIIDFGLSRRIDEVSFDEIAGTPGYLAPERSADSPNKIGMATDVFGLGAVVYNMLTNLSPFQGNTKSETYLNSVRGKLAAPKWGRWKVSRSTRRWVGACLERSPDHRPKTAEAVLKRIDLSQRQFLFRKVALAGLVFGCCLLSFAMVVMIDGKAEGRASDFAEHSGSSLDASNFKVFERLHDYTREFSNTHLRRGEFSFAEEVQLKSARATENFFPDAVGFKRSCEVHAAIFNSLAKLPDEVRTEIEETTNFLHMAFNTEGEDACFPGSEKKTRLFERAFKTSKRTLGADHGWTLICQGEHVLSQLLDLKQPLPTIPEFDSITHRLHNLYGGASKLETELHFLLRQRLIVKFKQQGADHVTVSKLPKIEREQDPLLKLIDKHSQRSVSLAQEYYQGLHSRQADIFSSLGVFDFFWLNEKERAVQLSQKAVQILEYETGTESNSKILALLTLAEQRISLTEYEAAIGQLRQARSIARHLVDNAGKQDAHVGSHKAKVAQSLLNRCNDQIAKISLLSKSPSQLEKPY